MVLDVTTTRVVLAVVAAVALAIFVVGAYRSTRSQYALWWIFALISAGVGTGAYLFNGTELQHLANPIGNVLGVCGTACVWFATRSVRGKSPRWLPELALVAGVAAASFLDSPERNPWAGGAALLAAHVLNLLLASRESVLALRNLPSGRDADPSDAVRSAIMSMLAASSALGAFYAMRFILFIAWGPDDPRFERWVGSAVTTLALSIVVIVATFSVDAISRGEAVNALRARATRDDLTGLLTRAEFLDRAATWRLKRGRGAALIIADLDHFKELNDALGHDAGDRALHAFGNAVSAAVGSRGIAGRIGGEEFAFLLDTPDVEQARSIIAQISSRYARMSPVRIGSATASFGLTVAHGRESLEVVMERADRALYRAKRAGRSRLEIDLAPSP